MRISASSNSLEEIGVPFLRTRSSIRATCGDVKRTFFRPFMDKLAAIIAHTVPFPLLPAT